MQERLLCLNINTLFSIDSVTNAEVAILQDSGASRRINESGEWVADRGVVDSRIINEYKDGTGFIPTHENDVGGYSVIPVTAAYSDSDHDGMADVWEGTHGFNVNSDSDNAQDKDGDGYTNIEEFINGTNPNSTDNETAFTTTEVPTIEEPIVGDLSPESANGGSTDSTLLFLLVLPLLFRLQGKGKLL